MPNEKLIICNYAKLISNVINKFLSWCTAITFNVRWVSHIDTNTPNVTEHLPFVLVFIAVELFLPVGGAIYHQIETMPRQRWTGVQGFHLEVDRITLRENNHSETFSSKTCTVRKGGLDNTNQHGWRRVCFTEGRICWTVPDNSPLGLHITEARYLPLNEKQVRNDKTRNSLY